MSIAAPDMVVDQGMQVPIPPPLSMPVPPPIQNVVQMQAVAEPSPALAMAAEVQGNQGVHVQHVQQAATMMMQAVPAYQPGFAPNHTYPVHHVVPGAPPQMDGMEQKGPESGSKRNRSWSEEERNSHKDACTGKRKLTLGEKLDIVRLHESTDPAEKKNQVQLASMYEKSRSAISKILQPDFVNKLKEIAATGVCTGVKRFIQSEHPALEKNIKQWVDGQLANGAIDFSGKRGDGAVSAVCKAAQELAVQAGIENFKASHGWYTRFIRRFGYTEADDNQRRKSEMEGRMQGGIQPMSAMQRVVPAMQVLAQVHFTVKLRVIPRGATEMSGKMMTVRLDVENDVKASRGYDMLLAMIRIQFGNFTNPFHPLKDSSRNIQKHLRTDSTGADLTCSPCIC